MRKWVAKYGLALLALCLSNNSNAQNNTQGVFTYGLRVGANYVSIANLKQTFCNDENLPTYDLKEKNFITPSVAAILQYRFPISQVAIGTSIAYNQTKSSIEKVTNSSSESYNLKMHYVTLNVGAKVYPIQGAFAKVSIGAGPCLNSTTCVKFDGTNITNTAEMQITERLNQSIKGKMLATASLALGYDFDIGLFVEAFYSKGLTDIIEVSVNNFGFEEQRNDSQYIGIEVGWLITKDGFSRRQL